MGTASRSAPPSAIERFAVLALRRDVSLGVLLSTHPRDFGVLLAATAQSFPKGHEFSEREVNDRLRAFLGDAGAMLGTDHVELRRWLVDFHLLDRDGFCRVYTAGAPSADIAELVAQLAVIDLPAVGRAARHEEAARRAERKERWEAERRSADG